MVLTAADPYPSRADEAQLIYRNDPTAWCDVEHVPPGPLTREQVERFDRDGYLALPGLFATEEVELLQQEIDRMAAAPGSGEDPRLVIDPDTGEFRGAYEVHRSREAFEALARDQRLAGAARQLVDSDVYIHQSRLTLEPALVGEGWSWHSDFETWHSEDGMPRMRCLSASVALTSTGELEGALVVAPGSHRTFVSCPGGPDEPPKPLQANHDAPRQDLIGLATLVDEGGLVAPGGPAGSVVLLDCNVLHASTRNLSLEPRGSAFLVYNSVENMLVEPYAGCDPRPRYLADREFEPIT